MGGTLVIRRIYLEKIGRDNNGYSTYHYANRR